MSDALSMPGRRRAAPGEVRRASTVLLIATALVALAGQVAMPGGFDIRPVQALLYPLEHQDEIARSGARYGVDPHLIAAVVQAESGFDPRAVSPVGAVGLMQVMPATAQWIVGRDDWRGPAQPDLADPGDNIELGTYYLAFLLDRFEGDVATALAAYNAGHGAVADWLGDGTSPDGRVIDPEAIPFRETRDFVARVERLWRIYAAAHPTAFRV